MVVSRYAAAMIARERRSSSRPLGNASSRWAEHRDEERPHELPDRVERGDARVDPEAGEPGEAEEHHQWPDAARRPTPPFLESRQAPGETDHETDHGGQRGQVRDVRAKDERRGRAGGGERRRPENKPDELHHEQYSGSRCG